MLPELIWAALALAVGLALVGMEFFIPSGGILGFSAAVALIVALVLASQHSVNAFLVVLLVVLGGAPTVAILALNWLPYTPVGRWVVLTAPSDQPEASDPWDRLRSLIGQTGRAATRMLPSGAIEVGGRTVDAVSQGIPIEPGQLVKITEVRGNRVVVVPLADASSQTPTDRTISSSQRSGPDLTALESSEFGESAAGTAELPSHSEEPSEQPSLAETLPYPHLEQQPEPSSQQRQERDALAAADDLFADAERLTLEGQAPSQDDSLPTNQQEPIQTGSPTTPQPTESQDRQTDQPNRGPTVDKAQAAGDPLSQPIESLGFDPSENPFS